jgi:hypothetical protein
MNPTTPAAPGSSPWRLVILDRDADDPKWLIVSVVIPSDVRPAVLDQSGRHADWPEVTRWIRDQLGTPPVLTPADGALVWHVDRRAWPTRTGIR